MSIEWSDRALETARRVGGRHRRAHEADIRYRIEKRIGELIQNMNFRLIVLLSYKTNWVYLIGRFQVRSPKLVSKIEDIRRIRLRVTGIVMRVADSIVQPVPGDTQPVTQTH